MNQNLHHGNVAQEQYQRTMFNVVSKPPNSDTETRGSAQDGTFWNEPDGGDEANPFLKNLRMMIRDELNSMRTWLRPHMRREMRARKNSLKQKRTCG